MKNAQKNSAKGAKVAKKAAAVSRGKPKASAERVARARGLSSRAGGSSRYRTALLNPFSDAAMGVRVPDQFGAPTSTICYREHAAINSDGAGNIEVIILPSVINPVFSSRGNIANGVTLNTPDGATFAQGAIYGSGANLYSKIVNHRIVSWGVRIRNSASLTNTSGMVTVALAPMHARMRVPGNFSIGGQTAGGTGAGGLTIGAWFGAAGIPYTGSGSAGRLDLTALTDFPEHVRFSAIQLAETAEEVRPKMVDPHAFEFRTSNDTVWGEDMQATTSAIYVQPGDASYIMCDGWTSIVIGGTGFPVSASSLDIEVVYHLEGAPYVTNGALYAPEARMTEVDPMQSVLAQAALSLAPPFIKAATGTALHVLRRFAGD